ncbi:unnamed protein product [Zymoseptoria tritici ST99CH_1E4]|uniref:Uncharacterized protein n=1 Tax=Zymoseptoria tritici ST99CH_1E4 TaxID=1276532 RepID=A0A2H1GYU1_ZYMTR|nr:unnamed protein product [Zymoseptoria tritici ST99CH_1E4]
MADRIPPENVLSGAYLSRVMVASLPTDVSPHLKTPADAIALGTHASMLAVGFRLVGLGEDHRIEAQSDSKETQPLPSEWNAQNGGYAFRYKHQQSSMEFLVKISRMGSKIVVNAMGLGDDRTCTFDLKATDFVSEGNLPLTIEGTNKDEADKKVIDTFISVGRLSDLGSLMRVKLIQKLVPSLNKEGYEEEQETSSSSTREPAPGREDNRPRRDPLREDRDPLAQPYPLHDPLAQPRRPRGPLPEPIPGFEDEFEVQRPPRGIGQPGGYPRIGDRDLHPQGLGPNDPFRGGMGPGFGGGMGGGGMHPTFDDPLFAGQGGRGGGYDPQAPPGSRFDPPFGPGGPGGGHPRGAGMGGRPPNPFGGFGGGDFI